MNGIFDRILGKRNGEIPGQMGYFERSKTRIMSRKNINRTSCEGPNRSSGLTRESSFSKPAWMKKLGSPFNKPTKPIKVQTPRCPVQPDPPKTIPENMIPRMESLKRAKTLPDTLHGTSEVDLIVQEFESGFSSPRTGFVPGTGNFVKRIVAAFEEKYNPNNDSWPGKLKGKYKDSGLHRHSYSNICESLNFSSVEISRSTDTPVLSTESSSTESSTIEDYRQPEAPKLKPTPQDHRKISLCKLDSQDPPSSDTSGDSTSNCGDQTPVIIGAFLKKPVKVQETSINWIPLPGKKLPRKKSLKKLLSTLSGINTHEQKEEIVFSSQVNVSEENRELPDSGYDEKSISSSSSSSIGSTPRIVPAEEIYVNIHRIPKRFSNFPNFNRRSTNLSTFQVPSPDQADDESDSLSSTSKKLSLYEVPRGELKVDLGPCYPAPSSIMVKSLDRRIPQNKILPSPLPKHPSAFQVPKHPFFGLSKDELDEPGDDDRAELRNPRDYRSSVHSSESEYDVPKSFLSRSESGISEVLKFTFDSYLDQQSYDVPKLRPKSSACEDALYLEKRNSDISNNLRTSQDYYSSPDEDKPHFATIRSKNRRFLNPGIFNSAVELSSTSMRVTSF